MSCGWRRREFRHTQKHRLPGLAVSSAYKDLEFTPPGSLAHGVEKALDPRRDPVAGGESPGIGALHGTGEYAAGRAATRHRQTTGGLFAWRLHDRGIRVPRQAAGPRQMPQAWYYPVNVTSSPIPYRLRPEVLLPLTAQTASTQAPRAGLFAAFDSIATAGDPGVFELARRLKV